MLTCAVCPECGGDLTRESVRVPGDERIVWPTHAILRSSCAFLATMSMVFVLIPATYMIMPSVRRERLHVNMQPLERLLWHVQLDARTSRWALGAPQPWPTTRRKALPSEVRLTLGNGRIVTMAIDARGICTFQAPDGASLPPTHYDDGEAFAQWMAAWNALGHPPTGNIRLRASDLHRVITDSIVGRSIADEERLVRDRLLSVAHVPMSNLSPAVLTHVLAIACFLATGVLAFRVATRKTTLARGAALPPFLADASRPASAEGESVEAGPGVSTDDSVPGASPPTA